MARGTNFLFGLRIDNTEDQQVGYRIGDWPKFNMEEVYVNHLSVGKTAAFIQVERHADDAMTGWDGNPDTGLRVRVRNEAINATSRMGARAVSFQVRNAATGTMAFLEGGRFEAYNKGQAPTVYGLTAFVEDEGTIATKAVGIEIEGRMQASTPTLSTLLNLVLSWTTGAEKDWGSAIRIATPGYGQFVYGIDMLGDGTNPPIKTAAMRFADDSATADANGATGTAGCATWAAWDGFIKVLIGGQTTYLLTCNDPTAT